jgi:glucose-6-phosphate isomerase
MLVFQEAYRRIGLNPSSYFVAVTLEDSDLSKQAKQENWLEIFPIWDWVGGRTSEFSAVGLLPAALCGVNIDRLLAGASAMDAVTRRKNWVQNPAMILALCWFNASSGKGNKAMIVLPYKDRLELFSRYLQQLVMESLGKEFDRDGRLVEQGLTIFGNKGSTDQHAYVQQLRDGIDNFFVNFIQVKSESDRDNRQDELSLLGQYEVEKGVTAGDYLHGFLQGTKEALSEKGRQHLSVCFERITEESIGSLIALYERAVGFYASFINVNAYHQPGVEAGKRAANEIIKLQRQILDYFRDNSDGISLENLCVRLNIEQKERCFHVISHLVSTGRLQISGDLKDPSSKVFYYQKKKNP